MLSVSPGASPLPFPTCFAMYSPKGIKSVAQHFYHFNVFTNCTPLTLSTPDFFSQFCSCIACVHRTSQKVFRFLIIGIYPTSHSHQLFSSSFLFFSLSYYSSQGPKRRLATSHVHTYVDGTLILGSALNEPIENRPERSSYCMDLYIEHIGFQIQI